jgi:Porin PorA
VVWANNVTVTPEGWDHPFQQSRELSSFDEVTGAASSYDVGFEEAENEEGELEQVDVTRKGQVYKFPFDTQKKDYLQWDATLGEATTAKYVGEDEVEGTSVYKFVQTIEPTVVATRPVPGSIFGVDEPTVQADMVYEMTRTLYIEPATGSPINRVEERNQVLSYDGTEVPAFVATVQYTDKSIADIIDKVDTRAPLLKGTPLLIPAGLLLLGLLSIGAGVLTRRRKAVRSSHHEHTDELVDA